MLIEDWYELSEKEKCFVVASMVTVSAVLDLVLAVKLIKVMQAAGILDYVLVTANEAVMQFGQYVRQLL